MVENIVKCVNIRFQIGMIMLDWKVVPLTDTLSTQTCNDCNAKPQEMMDLSEVRKKSLNKKTVGLRVLSMF